MILLNQTWQPIATGPCTIQFTNSSRYSEIVLFRAGDEKGSKKLDAFTTVKFETELQGEILARQASGKTITCEVVEKR